MIGTTLTGEALAVRDDFDRLAPLLDEGWGHNSRYHPFLLAHLPNPSGEALDVGCGTGTFSRRLAERFERVVGVDLSPEMIRLARTRSTDRPNVEYHVADVAAWPFPRQRFDCVASIATMHHLPFEGTLTAMREALRPGGVLLVLDLYQEQGVVDALVSALAVPVHLVLQRIKTGRWRESAEVRWAWEAHAPHDHYMTLDQIRQVCAAVLPGARVRRHLLWRYSIVWQKPGGKGAA